MAMPDSAIHIAPHGEGFLLEPMPPALLDDPLEYMFADHFRQRSLCVALRRYADVGEVPRAEAAMVIAYLTRDLPWHHQDEDEDLFPLLRQRALREDELGEALAQLTDDHHRAEPMVGEVIAALSAAPSGDHIKLAKPARALLRAYAASEHRHLAIENGIVLAIARIRLRRSDLAAMSRSMKARRGV